MQAFCQFGDLVPPTITGADKLIYNDVFKIMLVSVGSGYKTNITIKLFMIMFLSNETLGALVILLLLK